MTTSTQKMPLYSLPQWEGKTIDPSDFSQKLNLFQLIQPETKLEEELLETPEFEKGLNWGKPRFGHPEGKVGIHVREVLENIEQLSIHPNDRKKLRMIALVHDTFKYQEEQTLLAGKKVNHAIIARKFMENYTEDEGLLDLIELHDEAFYIWRQMELKNDKAGASARLERMMSRLGEKLNLYFLFFKCDTETGDKILSPLRWFENVVKNAQP